MYNDVVEFNETFPDKLINMETYETLVMYCLTKQNKIRGTNFDEAQAKCEAINEYYEFDDLPSDIKVIT